MKRLAVIYNPFLLLQLQHELDQAHIPYWIKNYQVQSLFGHLHYPNPALGPYEIWIKEEELERARDILDSFFLEDAIPTCPYCNEPLTDNLSCFCEQEE